MSWFSRLFGREEIEIPVEDEKTTSSDMRVTPVDNPMDFREDGSIRPGDPAYDFMMESMKSDGVMIANQREDGTWETS